MLQIDGSYGEGGGQILRTALALSCVTHRPFTLVNIRKGRPNPGLQPQHLTCVRAGQAISGATVEGGTLGSTTLTFAPGPVRPGDYRFDVAETKGSAGSVTLVLQTLLLPLALASFRGKHSPLPPGGGGERPALSMVEGVGGESTSQITVLGGTHVPWSPPAYYLQEVFLPLLTRLGIRVTLEIRRWGWYPQGGGEVAARIQPATTIAPLTWEQGGGMKRIFGVSAAANLPRSIAERQRDRAQAVLRGKGLEAQIAIEEAPSPGKGTILFLAAERKQGLGGASALGALGKRAETVAEEACAELLAYLATDAALDPHLADQILPWLALATGTSRVTTSRVTRHLLTNAWVTRQFLPAEIVIEGEEGAPGRITIRAGSAKPK